MGTREKMVEVDRTTEAIPGKLGFAKVSAYSW